MARVKIAVTVTPHSDEFSMSIVYRRPVGHKRRATRLREDPDETNFESHRVRLFVPPPVRGDSTLNVVPGDDIYSYTAQYIYYSSTS